MLGIFLDTETSGLNPFKHIVLEIAMKLIDLISGKQLASYSSIVFHKKADFEKADPNSLKVNGFTYQMLESGLPIGQVKEQILVLFRDFQIKRNKAVFICQNPSFDRAFFSKIIDSTLQEEWHLPYHWLDLASMFFGANAVQEKTPWGLGLSKDQIAAYFGLPKEESPHRAMQGVEHLILCYEKLIGFNANAFSK